MAGSTTLSKFSSRHRILAHLVALGYTNQQARDAFIGSGIKPFRTDRIATIRNLPEFRKRVREIQDTHMGSTVRSVLSQLAKTVVPSLKTMDQLRRYSEDDSVKLRASDRLYTAFEKAAGIGARMDEGNQGPVVSVNLTVEERASFLQASAEASGGAASNHDIPDAELVPAQPQKRLPAPKVAVRAKTIKELCAELEPQERCVESGAV